MTRAFSSGGKIGSTDWCWCFVVPPVFSLAALSVATSPPTEACAETPASAAAPQSHGRPVLGQSCARSQSQSLEKHTRPFLRVTFILYHHCHTAGIHMAEGNC